MLPQVREELEQVVNQLKELMMICDSCLMVAYDHGAGTLDEQEQLMLELGAEVEDHLCDEVETDGEVKCQCACRGS